MSAPEPAARPVPDVNSRFAASLKRLRAEQGLTAEGLSLKAGVSLDAVSRIERGKTGASLRTAYALATALGTGLDAMTRQPDEEWLRELLVGEIAPGVTLEATE